MGISRKFRTSAIALISIAGVSLASAADAKKIRVAGNFNTDHSSSIAMQKFSKELDKLTKGELTADIFPAMPTTHAFFSLQGGYHEPDSLYARI